MMDEKSVTLSFPHLKCSVEWMCDFMATMVTGVFVKMKDTLNRLHNRIECRMEDRIECRMDV